MVAGRTAGAWGDAVLSLLEGAREEAVLVAPFIKKVPFERLLASISVGVRVTCVTRWRVVEIATGVSDPVIWKSLKDRGGCAMFLQDAVHAKYYRADGHSLVGSANITDAGLGWGYRPNVELLVAPVDPDSLLEAFEKPLIAGAVAVDERLYEYVTEMAGQVGALLPAGSSQLGLANTSSGPAAVPVVGDAGTWTPRLRNPADLYALYRGRSEKVSLDARDGGFADLAQFDVPAGLPRALFEAEIGLQLLGMPIIREVDKFLETPRRFGEVRDLLARRIQQDLGGRDASSAWQTIMRWLRHFLPWRYRLVVPFHSEVIVRVED